MRTTHLFVLAALAACSAPPSEDVELDSGVDARTVYEWLVSEEVPTSSAILAVPDDRALADSKVQDEPRYRIGIAVTVLADIDLGTVTPAFGTTADVADGAIRFTNDGFVWSAVVESLGATALRLSFEDFALPAGAELYLYNDLGDVAGPYTAGHGVFYPQALFGDVTHLQIRYDGPDVATALDEIDFTLTEVGYLDERFVLGRLRPPLAGTKAHCTNLNATCVQNAECDLQDADDDDVVASLRAATGEMVFQSGPNWYLCTGGLIQSNNGATGHFLTANHCISTAAEAASLHTYWDFKVPCPPGGGPTTSCAYASTANSLVPSVWGAVIVDTTATTDSTLLRLNGTLPPGRVHLPYSTTPIATVNNAPLHRISYPSGAPQAYSHHTVDSQFSLCGAPGNFMYSRDVIGATEGGSSGSPVVNDAGEIVGQLYGACGSNLNDECDPVGNRTYDGAFAATWAQRALYRQVLGDPMVVLEAHTIPTLTTGQTWTESITNTGAWDDLTFTIAGNDPDADLYVKFGSPPTTTSYHCRPFLNGSNESCYFNPTQVGTYYVMVRAFSTFSGVTLTMSTTEPACADPDGDTICASVDNCPTVANPTQANADGDSLGDACDTCPNDAANDADADGRCANVDNCPTVANPTQTNSDGDTLGDACDICPLDTLNDADGDSRCANVDNCPTIANPSQANADGDSFGDACDTCPDDPANDGDADGVCGNVDNCPTISNSTQANLDGDGFGDACDACPIDSANDSDSDGLCANVDNCPTTANADQANLDGDVFGDACDTCPADAANDADADGLCANDDNCPTVSNVGQADSDGDGQGDACDACPIDPANDSDSDGVCGNADNCPTTPNASQANVDGDAQGDACDPCPADPANDSDGDGACGDVDNCPATSNPSQADADGDGSGDACDACPNDPADDADADGLCANADNCPTTSNAGQENSDGDAHGDACDICPIDADNDGDGDGLCANVDNCPDDANAGQQDGDGDGEGDACDACPDDPDNDSDADGVCGDLDNCPATSNASQADTDGDGAGDACDACPNDEDDDTDADGVCGDLDNCPTVPNAAQDDSDDDSYGDDCDLCPFDADNDADADDVCGDEDNCPDAANPEQEDGDLDGLGDVCDLCFDDVDTDQDGLCDLDDNCPDDPNFDQDDSDIDFVGDACDFCPLDPGNDSDADGECGDTDNCPAIANADQANADGDGLGDACDACPDDAANDADGDGVCGDVDNCPTTANAGQANADGDASGDACDACPLDSANDIDGDGVCGDVDNCPTTANAGQANADGDASGDACDACPLDSANDIDGDGVCGDVDNCPTTANADQANADGDAEGDACDACPTIPFTCTPPEVCNDDVDNDGDSAIDCADSDCAASPACVWVVLQDTDFETGLGPYTDGGADAQRLSTSFAHQGSFAVELRDNSTDASSISWTNGVDLTGYDELEVTFWYQARSFEPNEDFYVELSNGATWQVIGRFIRGSGGTNFANNTFYNPTLTVSDTSVVFTSSSRLRIRADASDDNDDLYIDEVRVSAR